jgi:hypothetical protein
MFDSGCKQPELYCLAPAKEAVAVAIAAAVTKQVNREGDGKHNPFETHDAPREYIQIRQGRPRQEYKARQRVGSHRQVKDARQVQGLNRKRKALRIRYQTSRSGKNTYGPP